MELEETTKQLINYIKEGDRFSFDKLVSLYEKTVYRICHRFFNNEEDALDATQEVFIKVYRYIDKFEGRSSFKTWIYRIAANTCLTISENKKKEKEGLLQNMINWWNSITESTPEEKVLENEERVINKKLVGDCIAKIPEVYRIPLILKDMEGMALEKISDILEIPVGTVKSRLNRGRALLHDKIILASSRDATNFIR